MLTLFPRYSFVLFLDKKDDEVQQQEPDFARRRLDDAAAAAADRSGIGDNTVDVIAIVYIVSILLIKCSADALCVSFFMNNGRQPQLRMEVPTLYHTLYFFFIWAATAENCREQRKFRHFSDLVYN